MLRSKALVNTGVLSVQRVVLITGLRVGLLCREVHGGLVCREGQPDAGLRVELLASKAQANEHGGAKPRTLNPENPERLKDLLGPVTRAKKQKRKR